MAVKNNQKRVYAIASSCLADSPQNDYADEIGGYHIREPKSLFAFTIFIGTNSFGKTRIISSLKGLPRKIKIKINIVLCLSAWDREFVSEIILRRWRRKFR